MAKVEFLEENNSILETSNFMEITNSVDDSEKFVFKKIFLKIDGRYLKRSLCFVFEKNGENFGFTVHKINKENGDPFYTLMLRCDKYRNGSKSLNLDICSIFS